MSKSNQHAPRIVFVTAIVISMLATALCFLQKAKSANCSATILFQPARRVSVGAISVGTTVADFNEDGKPDFAVPSSSGLAIFLGDGNGNFGGPTFYPASSFIVPVATADFNNDGHVDLAAGSSSSNVWIYLGDGAGGFSAPATFPNNNPGYTYGIAVGDFNNDNREDLAIGNQFGHVSILLGNGQGGFGAPTLLNTGADPLSLVSFDFNSDGKADIAVCNQSSNNISVLLGNGSGGFGSSNNYATGHGPTGFAVGDFNSDSKLDLVVANTADHTFTILVGDGSGGFAPQVISAGGADPQNVRAGDFNLDGKLDLATVNTWTDTTSVLLGDGAGNFGSASSFAVSDNPVFVTVADVNLDSKPDILVPSFYGADVSVLINDGTNDVSPPVITVSDVTADATGPAGAEVSYSVAATDNSGRDPSLNCSFPSGSTFPIGVTTVTCTASDACGNSDTRNFNVSVVDQPPVLSLPNDVHATATGSSGVTVNYSVTAMDAVSGSVPVNCNPASGANFPIGQTTVTCSATDGDGHTSTGSFTVSVFGCIGCIVPTFEPSRDYGIDGGNPFRTAAGDFNNDGKMDIAETVPGSVAIFYGDGVGNFATPVYLPAGGFDVPPASGDFNHDGKTDLAVGSSDGVVYIYLNNGSGLSQPTFYADHGGEAYEIAVADFNSDGNIDLAIGHQFAGLAILFGDGNGGFADPIDYLQGNGPVQVSKGDLNGDAKIDLITANAGTGDTSLLLNNGNGSFTVSSAPIPPTDFGVADFNGDGKTDVVAGTGDSSVGLYLGNGQGGFTFAGNFDTGGSGVGNGIKAADFNGDGKMDLVVANGWSDTVSILVGDGHGLFSPPLTFATASGPIGITATDLNADGKPDIAVAAYFAGQLSVLINSTYQTPVGTNATVVVNNTTFTFDEVTTGGTTTVTPIDPASVGEVPGGFAVSNSVAYEIGTTATFSGSVTLAFKVPGPISEEDFNSLAILHNVNGTLVDVTASTPARDYSNLTIYATTTSFSPFYLARRGSHIKSLFDQTKAYKRGSTIPIKLQVLNASNANLSSSNTSLVTRDLRLMSGNTLAPIEDSGNANPDYTFRYDSSLGGAGGGYIFNLSTKGLAPGQYVLSFYVGAERSFFYTVKFEVK